VGQNSKKRRDAKKRRQHRPAERSESQGIPIVPLSGTQLLNDNQGDERSTVVFLAMQYGQLPREPSCDGPVLIHQDGTFECHGTCEGATTVFHDDDALAPCGYNSIPTRTACVRCAHLPRGD